MISKSAFSILLGLFAIILLTATLLPVHAASVLVQQSNGGCFGCSSTLSVSLANNAVGGDVIVVGIVVGGASFGLNSLTDSLGSSFTQAVRTTSTVPPIVYIYCATLSKGGVEIITATFSAAAPAESLYIYEVSGVTTTGVATATGSGTGASISTSSSVLFQPGAFLLGIVGTDSFGGTAAAGAGFILSRGNAGTDGTYAEYSTSGVSSPTSFAATANSAVSWAEDGIVLMPN